MLEPATQACLMLDHRGSGRFTRHFTTGLRRRGFLNDASRPPAKGGRVPSGKFDRINCFPRSDRAAPEGLKSPHSRPAPKAPKGRSRFGQAALRLPWRLASNSQATGR